MADISGRSHAMIEYCPGCRERKPLEQYLGANFVYDPEDPPTVCAECREKGPPPRDPFGMLTRAQRVALKELMQNGTAASAARVSGLSESYVRTMMKGRAAPEFRRAFQMLLEMEGLDIFSIAKTLRSCSVAMEAKYNSDKGEFEYFPDMKTRLQTMRTLTKLHELEPPRREESEHAITIHMEHNLPPPGERDVTPPRHGEYEVIPAEAESEETP